MFKNKSVPFFLSAYKFIFIILVFFEASSQAQELELITGTEANECIAFLENLKRFDNLRPHVCGFKIHPNTRDISLPDWQPIDAAEHIELIRSYIAHDYSKHDLSKDKTTISFKLEIEKRLKQELRLIGEGRIKLSIARLPGRVFNKYDGLILRIENAIKCNEFDSEDYIRYWHRGRSDAYIPLNDNLTFDADWSGRIRFRGNYIIYNSFPYWVQWYGEHDMVNGKYVFNGRHCNIKFKQMTK